MNDQSNLPQAATAGHNSYNQDRRANPGAIAAPQGLQGLPKLRPDMTPDEIRAASEALKQATARGRPSPLIDKWRAVIEAMLAGGNTVRAIYDYLAINDDEVVREFETYKKFNAKLKRDLDLG